LGQVPHNTHVCMIRTSFVCPATCAWYVRGTITYVVRVAGRAADALRDRYAEEFKFDPLLKEWATKGPPRTRTKASSIASGKRVERGQAAEKDEAYKAVDIFTSHLWYHDKNNHVLYDNAHQFANVLKQLLNVIKNRNKKDKLAFNPEIRKTERNSGT
jgi:hypothetical protein